MEPLLKSPWKRSSRVSTFNHLMSSLWAHESLWAAGRRPPLLASKILVKFAVYLVGVYDTVDGQELPHI